MTTQRAARCRAGLARVALVTSAVAVVCLPAACSGTAGAAGAAGSGEGRAAGDAELGMAAAVGGAAGPRAGGAAGTGAARLGGEAKPPSGGSSAGRNASMGDDRDAGQDDDAGSAFGGAAGELFVLTYNVAGLPEPLSSSMPMRNTPLIAPLLNRYDLVFLQESWQTPDPNPLAPLRGYHEILVAGANQPYKTAPAMQPFGNEPTRPTALLGDGLNIFSRLELAETTRVAWRACVDTEADCLAMKGFSHTPARIADGLAVHLYDLHMEAGGSAEDDQARDAGIDQLIAFIAEHSRDVAVIVAGDFNLHTTEEPAKSQLARLLRSAELRDSCEQLDCSMPGNIDKVLYRSSSQLRLAPHSWVRDTQEFVTTDGEPLSDHAPVSVRFSWRFSWSAER